MSLEQEPFRKYNVEKSADTFTVRLNEDERKILNEMKALLRQPKDSTALKNLAMIGAKALHRSEMSFILDMVFENKRIAIWLGITEFE